MSLETELELTSDYVYRLCEAANPCQPGVDSYALVKASTVFAAMNVVAVLVKNGLLVEETEEEADFFIALQRRLMTVIEEGRSWVRARKAETN